MTNKVTIKFSDDVLPAFCSVSIRGISWTKNGDRTGFVENLPKGRSICSWGCMKDPSKTTSTYTVTLSDNAVFEYTATPPPSSEKKTDWSADEGGGAVFIRVSESGGE